MGLGLGLWTVADIGSPEILLLVLLGLACFILLIFLFQYGWIYIRAAVSGAHVRFVTLIAMRLRRVDASAIVRPASPRSRPA